MKAVIVKTPNTHQYAAIFTTDNDEWLYYLSSDPVLGDVNWTKDISKVFSGQPVSMQNKDGHDFEGWIEDCKLQIVETYDNVEENHPELLI